MKKSICFIINPKSGVSKKTNIPEIIYSNIDTTSFDVVVEFTEYKGHATELSEDAVNNNVDVVCAVGGDGSIHEVAKSLIHSTTKLAILPCGSGNGFARHLNIPLNIEEAIRRINISKESLIDTGLINGHPFINVCGFGFDALIAHKFDNYHKRGFNSYVKLVLNEFNKFTPQNVRFNNEEEDEKSNLLLTSVANASQFGNGFKISPLSDLQDGRMELLLLKKSSTLKLLPDLVRFFTGKIHNSHNAQFISFDEIELHLESNLAHVDGEPLLLKNNKAHIKVNPQSLKILT
jgi:YegS/Rv2252/BmrU family lipid kinase